MFYFWYDESIQMQKVPCMLMGANLNNGGIRENYVNITTLMRDQ